MITSRKLACCSNTVLFPWVRSLLQETSSQHSTMVNTYTTKRSYPVVDSFIPHLDRVAKLWRTLELVTGTGTSTGTIGDLICRSVCVSHDATSSETLRVAWCDQQQSAACRMGMFSYRDDELRFSPILINQYYSSSPNPCLNDSNSNFSKALYPIWVTIRGYFDSALECCEYCSLTVVDLVSLNAAILNSLSIQNVPNVLLN